MLMCKICASMTRAGISIFFVKQVRSQPPVTTPLGYKHHTTYMYIAHSPFRDYKIPQYLRIHSGVDPDHDPFDWQVLFSPHNKNPALQV